VSWRPLRRGELSWPRGGSATPGGTRGDGASPSLTAFGGGDG